MIIKQFKLYTSGHFGRGVAGWWPIDRYYLLYHGAQLIPNDKDPSKVKSVLECLLNDLYSKSCQLKCCQGRLGRKLNWLLFSTFPCIIGILQWIQKRALSWLLQWDIKFYGSELILSFRSSISTKTQGYSLFELAIIIDASVDLLWAMTPKLVKTVSWDFVYSSSITFSIQWCENFWLILMGKSWLSQAFSQNPTKIFRFSFPRWLHYQISSFYSEPVAQRQAMVSGILALLGGLSKVAFWVSRALAPKEDEVL